MKCAYCGKQFSGDEPYCSDRCRKQGQAAARLASKTRIPFWILAAGAGITALVGIVFFIAGAPDQGFLALGAAAVALGLALVAFPRGRRSGSAAGQILGGVLFALGVICVLLWR